MSTRTHHSAPPPVEIQGREGEVKPGRLVAALAVGVIVWLLPTPEGLADNAWHLFAIFAATIVAIILSAAPMGSLSIVSIAVCAATGVLVTDAESGPSEAIGAALSGFSNGTIWLIVSAFFIARAVIASGLGTRLGYLFVRLFGRSTLGLAYGFGLADLATSPAIPSNTARAGGIVFPIMQSVLKTEGTVDGDPATYRRMASFLAIATYNLDLAASVIFFTGAAPNAMGTKLAAEMGADTPTWGGWLLLAVVPGLVGFILTPLVLYVLYKPEVTKTPEAPRQAMQALEKLGPMKSAEKITLTVFITIIVLWVFGGSILNATTVAFIGLALLLVTGVLSWDDIKSEKSAWDTLVWFAALVMMGTYLNKTGFIAWIGNLVKDPLAALGPTLALVVIVVVYAFSHYLFASGTAHTAAMFSVFLGTGIAVGLPALPLVVVLGALPTLMGCLTHYGNGPAPLYFGTGYVPVATWWKLGAVLGVMHVVIWLTVGPAWWGIIGAL
ncbi:anion transporter [Corynebacterium renale]|uniref:DASS family divalent anion:Na+ symporter n=1 Tax=Corynebacterium renale TaxID=1724 RepID=A0A2A9DQL0_9CORY|nr:DASS family divalent anion:Na+ symporter [Corynebacterium renale]SQI20059.1 anion transporter [Corynebacterium renale]